MTTKPPSGFPRRARAAADYAAQYADPIAVHAGEPLRLDGRLDHWAGNPEWLWRWCVDPRGKAGWVPDEYIVPAAADDGEPPRARTDYCARELTVAAGDSLIAERFAAGWVWCRSQRDGATGWVPISALGWE